MSTYGRWRLDPDLGSGSLRKATVRFSIQLRPGTHRLPIPGGAVLRFEVPNRCEACGSVELGPVEAGLGDPSVRDVRIEFTRPLAVQNPIEVLVHLYRRYRDKDLTAWVDDLPPPWNTWARARTGRVQGRMTDLAKAGVTVLLSGLTLRATRAPSGAVEMRPAFSGRVGRAGGGVTWPFSGVVLPLSVLPAFHASLDRLLAGDFLASGPGHRGQDDYAALARSLWTLALEMEADVEAHLTLPGLTWETETSDRTHLCAEIRYEDPRVELEARIRATFSRSRLALHPSFVVVRVEDHPGQRASFEVRGFVVPDFRKPADSRVALSCRIADETRLPQCNVLLEKRHPLTVGRVGFAMRVGGADARGRFRIAREGGEWRISPLLGGVKACAQVEMRDETVLERRDDTLRMTLRDTRVQLAWERRPCGWGLRASLTGDLTLAATTRLTPLPELHVNDPLLRADFGLKFRGEGHVCATRGGAELSVEWMANTRAIVRRFIAELDGRRLTMPRGAVFSASWRPNDPREESSWLTAKVSWDLRGRIPRLSGLGRTTDLLVEDLLHGELTALVSPGGRLSFRGERSGLYGVQFFNALLDPASEPRHWLDVLASDEAMGHVVDALAVFNPDLARWLERIQRWSREAQQRLQYIKSPADVIEVREMSRALSVLLVGHEGLVERLVPILRSVLEGQGIPMVNMAAILREIPSLHGWGYEVGGALRWLDLVVKAGEPLPPPEAVPTEPLAVDPAWAWAREGFPSATEVVASVEGEVPPPPPEQVRIARSAPRMTLRQVDHLWSRARGTWDPEVVRFLERIREVKRRVNAISREGYGGFSSLGQAALVASLIGDAVGPLPSLGEDPEGRPPGILGPEDVAILLQAGLSQARQGTQTQVNNRLLMEYLRVQPRDFTREVLIEMGHHVESALAGVLFAFLAQDQDRMATPLDLPAFLEERLGLPVPRHEDYLAGGRHARESYFEALVRLAERIMKEAPPLLSRRAHIQEVRHTPGRTPRRSGRGSTLAHDARRAIAAADRLARDLSSEDSGSSRVRQAYETAFEACAEFLREVPDGFTLPWMKAFWSRNEEALKALSVVRAFEEDQDDVRSWMRVVSGRDRFRDRSDLLDTVISVLWASAEDRESLRADPLVRALLPVPDGRLRFTVVACMGVITDGEHGRELEDAFRRLEERRGVRVIRAHTGLFWPLEQNAAAVIRAIEKAATPYGLLGYSQGCANALMAEHWLRSSGTPDEQRLLDRLVCRNLLFSAANGSVHGTSGERKFIRAMVEGERFLKHYQAIYSREASRLLFRLLKATLDSPGFLRTVAGAHSLTLERAAALHRDGQFRWDVPTSTTRGIATLDRLPEALVYLFHCHERLLPGAEHDSQVSVEEAVGHATRVRNAWTEAFARCDMGSKPLYLHHWAPITAEVERVTTRSDRERAVYQGPKDLLVVPWIEVNARFGRISYDHEKQGREMAR